MFVFLTSDFFSFLQHCVKKHKERQEIGDAGNVVAHTDIESDFAV